MPTRVFRPLVAALALVASFVVVVLVHQQAAAASGPLSRGNLTMVSTLADGTTGPALPTTEGADEEAISDDGKVVAFTSRVPAEQLVTDPTQTGHVTDTNNVDDVFVWDSRVPAPIGPIVSLVSQNASKTGTGDAASTFPTVAPEGIGVVFESGATNLTSVPVGAQSNHLYAWVPLINSIAPVFMVDENFQGTAGSNSVSDDASIAVSPAPPMVRVAFHSTGTDLVDPAVHVAQADEVYVRTYTLATPSTQMVSVGTDGKGTASGASEPMISADAQHVVFSSGGDSLVSGINGTGGDIFERNLLTTSTTLISPANAGGQGTSGNNSPVINASGTAIAWDGNDATLSSTPHSALAHVFYWNVLTGVSMVDTDLTGVQGCNQFSNSPGISLDGTMVDYESACTDSTAPSITSSGLQVFARRMVPDPAVPALPDPHPELISVNAAGTGSGNADAFLCPGNNPPHCGASSNPGITMNADGTAIAFFSQSGNLPGVVTPPQGVGNVFVRYPATLGGGSTVDVTTTAGATNADEDSRDPVMSADGGTVAFVSLADDLVTPDTNGATDVFTADLHNSFVFQPISAVNEGDGKVTISVTRTGSNGTSDSVEVTTGDGSTPDLPLLPPEITNPANSNATAPADYTAVDKTLLFPPGVPTETFSVPIVDDNIAESAELFHVSLSSAKGAGTTALPGPLSEAYVVILDNDTPPGVTVEQAAGQSDPTSTSPITFTATFSQPVTGFTASDVTLGGTAGGSLVATVSGGPSVYTVSVSGMTTAGTVTASLPAGAAMDGASNPSTASTSVDNSVQWTPPDVTSPSVLIDQAVGQADPTSTSPITFTATFSEPVTGFTASDVALGGTAGGSLVATVSGGPIVYTVSVSGMTTAGTVTASVPAGAALDGASNPSTASTSADNSVQWIPADVTPPSVLIDQAVGQTDPTSTSPITFTATFSEPVTGFTAADVSFAGSTAGGALTAIVTGGPTVYTVSVSGMTTAGSVKASVPAGAAIDGASNPSTASTSADNSVQWTPVDVTPPTVTVEQAAAQGDPTSTSPITFTATFSEPVTGFTASDVTLGGTAGGSLVATVSGGPTVYTVSVNGMTTAGTVIASVPAGAALDGASNPSTASTSVDHSVQWNPADVTPPSVVINQAAGQGDPTSTSPITFTATFSEPVTGFTASDVTLGGTAGGTLVATVSGGPTVYTVSVSGMTTAGTVIASVPAGAAIDGASNPSTASTSVDHSVKWNPADVTPPSVLIDQAVGQADPTSTSPITFTATFSEPVTGFTASDVSFSGSTAGGSLAATVTGGPIAYTVSVSGMTTAGTVKAALPAGAAIDGASNPSTASTSADNTVQWTPPDLTPPSVTINQAPGQSDPTSTSPITFTATFSEPVTGFTASDVTLGGTAGGSLTATVSGGPTVYTVSVSGMTTAGTVTASVPAGAAFDAASNPSTVSTSVDHSVQWTPPDVTPPSVVVGQAVGQADPTSTSPITFTATFSEPVTGFDTSDVHFTGSTAGGSLTAAITGGPAVYTLSVSGMTAAGTVKVSLPAGAAIDGASNPSTASTSVDNSVTWTVAKTTSSVGVVVSPSPAVFGQAVTATATVSQSAGTPAGMVQFAVDASPVGAPVPVGPGGVATIPSLAPLAVGARTVSATFTPSNPATVNGSTGSTMVVVNRAATAASVAVHPTAITAAVVAVAPGSGTPTGTVTFSVDGHPVGTAPLSGGHATLTFTTPAGMTRHVAAVYGGSAQFTASSASTSRNDPSITAHVSSAHARTAFGWYRSAVTVTFTCTTHGAPLTAPCPAPVTLKNNGAAQSVSRTIAATDGGIRTVVVKGLSIDHTAPSVHLAGATKGHRYLRPGPKIHCAGSDALSGLASCVLTGHATSGALVDTVHYTVVAKDKAGNVRTTSGSYQLAAFVLAGATFSKGAWTVHRGSTYTLVVVGTALRPTYYDAAPFPMHPFHRDNDFHAAGHHRWTIAVLIQLNLASHTYWNLGVKIGNTIHSVKIRAVA